MTITTNELRLMTECAIVRELIERAQRSGFRLDSIADSDGEIHQTETVASALSLVFNLDECTLRFRVGRGSNLVGALLVMGNGPDVISDYTDDGGDDVMNPRAGSFAAACAGVSDDASENRIVLNHLCERDAPAWTTSHGARGQCINCGRTQPHGTRMMSLDEFRASGRDVDDLGELNGDVGGAGRVYAGGCYVEHERSGDGWHLLIANQEWMSMKLELLEEHLYEFALGEELAVRP